MTTVRLSASLDIESALQDAIEAVSLSGMGADGTSEYEITDVLLVPQEDGSYEVTVTCERLEGKFVGADEMAEMIAGEVENITIDVDVIQI